jgi:hypothetical protein
LLEHLIEHCSIARDRVVHVHYPLHNRVVAEQLKIALTNIGKQHDGVQRREYVLVYNADSIVDPRAFRYFIDYAKQGVAVCQQSSLFLWNVPKLLSSKADYTANHGLYQSCWTIHHELSRYTFSRTFLPWLPKWLAEHSLVHCVGHGLLIRADVLAEVGGFPVLNLGLEDLALGLTLKVHGYHVEPFPILENAETPARASIVWNQLARWFLGTAGYLVYWKIVPRDVRIRHWDRVVAVTVLGIMDALKWLFKGPVIVVYLYLGLVNRCFFISAGLLAIYFYLPLVSLYWLWHRLSVEYFPRPAKWDLARATMSYWVIPISRSGPAWLGLVWALGMCVGFNRAMQKTERE